MNELLDKILEQTTLKKIVILAGTLVLVFALYFSFFYSPRSDEIAKLADSVEIARNEKQVKLSKAANMARLQTELRVPFRRRLTQPTSRTSRARHRCANSAPS